MECGEEGRGTHSQVPHLPIGWGEGKVATPSTSSWWVEGPPPPPIMVARAWRPPPSPTVIWCLGHTRGCPHLPPTHPTPRVGPLGMLVVGEAIMWRAWKAPTSARVGGEGMGVRVEGGGKKGARVPS